MPELHTEGKKNKKQICQTEVMGSIIPYTRQQLMYLHKGSQELSLFRKLQIVQNCYYLGGEGW